MSISTEEIRPVLEGLVKEWKRSSHDHVRVEFNNNDCQRTKG